MAKKNWMDVEIDKNPDVVIIDCGYVTSQKARDHADAIFALGVSKKNLVWGASTGIARIHINIPQTKVKKIMAALPISDKKTWFGATHSYV